MMGSAADVAAALRGRSSVLLTSHARPDGDALGSTMALALALESLGIRTQAILADPVPEPYRVFPAVERITIGTVATQPADAAVILECSDISRPGISGLDRYFLVNVDHHAGNTNYGAVNWFDGSACACGEMVADVIDALGVRWTPEIAAHLYLAITTDTGGFRFGPISARTFDVCRRLVEAGIDPAALARQIFDSYSIGRVRLTGALLDAMELHHDRRVAVLAFDDALLTRCGATADDTDGLVNLPLGAREVLAVALFKAAPGDTWRVSLRSKGRVDVRRVAMKWGGGGHVNAAGLTVPGPLAAAKAAVVDAVGAAVAAADA
jgi:phosphoesterase RecJ-like protein